MTEPVADDRAREIAEVLAAHRPLPIMESGGILLGYGCPAPCAWGNEGGYDLDAHRTHLATILAQRAAAPGAVTCTCHYLPDQPCAMHPLPAAADPRRLLNLDSPSTREVFHRVLTGVGVAGLDQILLDALAELYGVPQSDTGVDAYRGVPS